MAEQIIAVELTGMGDDGAEAMTELHSAGARTIAESRESAVVFGMPAELIRRGGASAVLPVEEVAGQLMIGSADGPRAPGPEAAPGAERRDGPRDGAGLIAALSNPSADVRRWAALDLAGNPDSVAPLAAQLAGEADQAVREAALNTLAGIGGPAVVEALVPMYAARTPQSERCRRVPQQIPDSLDAVRLLLADRDADMRVLAVTLSRRCRPGRPRLAADIVAHRTPTRTPAAPRSQNSPSSEPGRPRDCHRTAAARFPNDPFVAFTARTFAAGRSMARDDGTGSPRPERPQRRRFMRLSNYFYQRTGIRFEDNKRYFVDKRVIACVEARRGPDFTAWFTRLRLGGREVARAGLLNRLTVHETYFLREDYQFECMVAHVLPEILRTVAAATRADPVRPVLDRRGAVLDRPVAARELAGDQRDRCRDRRADIDVESIATARKGVYGARALQRLTPDALARWFDPSPMDTSSSPASAMLSIWRKPMSATRRRCDVTAATTSSSAATS